MKDIAQITPAGPLADWPRDGYLREADLVGNPRTGRRGLLPFSRTTLWRLVRDQHFPAPVKLSVNITAWQCEEVRSWLARLA